MTSWIPPETRIAALAALDRRLVTQPDDFAALFDRACLLAGAGRIEEAKQAYLALLSRASNHAGALNNLGTLLLAQGHRRAARLAYAEAVKHHPGDPMGRINFANVLQAFGETRAAEDEYRAALALDPTAREAHRGLAQLLSAAGDEAMAERHRILAFRDRAMTLLPYRGQAAPIPLLTLVSARDGNLAYETLIDDTLFETTMVVTEFFDDTIELPQHRLILNAIGEADLCPLALARAKDIVRRSAAPVINRPEAVLATGRSDNAQRLDGLPGVRVPKIVELPRVEIGVRPLLDRGFRFPLLLRSPGFHMGRHFVLVPGAEAIDDAVFTLPGADLMAIEFLDAAERDGRSRKYRVMIIDRQIYPLHLAVSQDWKVHYFSAQMADHPEDREEEADFLADLPHHIGTDAMRALEAIRDAIGLDYGGIDFGLSATGEILLFEANATMIAAMPPPDAMWDYRREPAQRVREAARRMLASRAGVAL